jgi:hypothetical protein
MFHAPVRNHPDARPRTQPEIGAGFCLELMWSGRNADGQMLEVISSYTCTTSCFYTGMSWGDLYIYLIPLVLMPSTNIPKLATLNLKNMQTLFQVHVTVHYRSTRHNLDMFDSYLCSIAGIFLPDIPSKIGKLGAVTNYLQAYWRLSPAN